jgi:hypothetical protein
MASRRSGFPSLVDFVPARSRLQPRQKVRLKIARKHRIPVFLATAEQLAKIPPWLRLDAGAPSD